ncbi:hypothetical protein HK102_004644 [Quaeritorhiza haematococci]|nr:hypothetical protein HK102_004644 [Quaeritorhiza haematococci]
MKTLFIGALARRSPLQSLLSSRWSSTTAEIVCSSAPARCISAQAYANSVRFYSTTLQQQRRELPFQRSPSSLTNHSLTPNWSYGSSWHQHQHHQRRPLHAETLKPPKLEPHQIPLILIVVGVGTFVFAYDLYYYLYLHEPAVRTLSPDEFRPFTLKEIIPLTPTTSLFRFAASLPAAESNMIPVPSYVVVKDDSCQIARAYTPVMYGRYEFDLVVRRYEEGSVSRFLHGLRTGERVEMRGPVLSFPYQAGMADEIGMIAGGTGITPMYQLIKHILRNPDDPTRLTLVYANRTEDEIILRNELELLARTHPDRLRIHYTLDKPPSPDWKDGRSGVITKELLKETLPSPEGMGNLVLVCGPEGMVRHVAGTKPNEDTQGPVEGLLKQLGYTNRNVFKF